MRRIIGATERKLTQGFSLSESVLLEIYYKEFGSFDQTGH